MSVTRTLWLRQRKGGREREEGGEKRHFPFISFFFSIFDILELFEEHGWSD